MDPAQLESTLAATLQVVEAQRAQLHTAQEELETLRLQLESERRAKEVAEEKLREASVDFARKLSQMQARVFEAERDVVLGGQVLVARSGPGTSGIVSAAVEGPPRLPGETPRGPRRAPVPPPPRSGDEAAFSRSHVPGASGVGSGSRRTRSAQHTQRLEPLLSDAGCATVLAVNWPSDELEEVEQSLKEDSSKQKKFWSVAVQALTLTFLAEWGDRSQISTIALAAAKDPLGVTLGGIIGHSCCTTLAVMGGRVLAEHISERMVVTAGGVLFLCFALHGAIMGAD
ncbi:unnamed protein product [Durusdinium trenchii]|uniref:GDT1 family protein n=1 Tax=Durusdinium trenchii TaxID=1381693 RepID=A0ABP0HE94_9DINO